MSGSCNRVNSLAKLGFALYGSRGALSRKNDRHLSNYISKFDLVIEKEGVANVEKSSHVPSKLDAIDVTSTFFVEPRLDNSPPVDSGPVDPLCILESDFLMQNESFLRVKIFFPNVSHICRTFVTPET